MIVPSEIIETIKMIQEENLDIRTITVGISLLDCIDSNGERAREKIYNKITTVAKHLVKTAAEIEKEYGIPITNKRISVTPLSLIAEASGEEGHCEFARTLDRAADNLGVDFIGGFSALVHKGNTQGEDRKSVV